MEIMQIAREPASLETPIGEEDELVISLPMSIQSPEGNGSVGSYRCLVEIFAG